MSGPPLPILPQRPFQPDHDGKEVVHTDLPENIHFCSYEQIRDMVQNHRDMLELYVRRFQPQGHLIQEVQDLRGKLERIEQQFDGLERDKVDLEQKLGQMRIVESRYVSKWQDLERIINEKYSDDALKGQLELKLSELDYKSVELEKEGPGEDSKALDQFVEMYMQLRTEYHLQREKLSVWTKQGMLRKS